MVQRIGTLRRKTRSKFKKEHRNKGKLNISSYFQKFKVGDRVALKVEPAVQKGMYVPRYHGITGKIAGMQGKCCKVEISDKGKKKELLVHPVHLKRL